MTNEAILMVYIMFGILALVMALILVVHRIEQRNKK